MRVLLTTLIILSSVLSQAKTLFISDIDDTIKISYVLDKSNKVSNTIMLNNHFYGMAQLYQAYKVVDPAAQFAYLSAAPRYIMSKAHKQFLHHNRFVTGEVFLRENLSDENFKIATIRSLIIKHRPEKIIMIGDNGERDPHIYAQAQLDFPEIPMKIYIHQVYSVHNREDTGAAPQPNQTQFVTAIDLARSLLANGQIPQNIFDSLASAILPTIVNQPLKDSRGSLAIPAWVDCRDFFNLTTLQETNWHPAWRPFWKTKPTLSQWLAAYDEKLKSRCLNGPIDD